MDPYTHKFVFNVADKEIKGECELNAESGVSYKIAGTSAPLPAKTMRDFTEFMDLMNKFYKGSGEIKTIKLIKKGLE